MWKPGGGGLASRSLDAAGSGLSVRLCLARLGQGSFLISDDGLAAVSASQHPLSLIISRGLFNDPNPSQVFTSCAFVDSKTVRASEVAISIQRYI